MNALGIISRALRLIGVYANGEAPTGSEASDALSVLNSLIQSFGNQSLLIFTDSGDSIPFIANQATATIGPTGTIVSPRPVSLLDYSYVQFGQVSYPLEVLTNQEYASIALKGLITGIPTSIYLDTTMPNSTIYLYPIPSQAMTLNLRSNKRLATLNLTDDLVFPDGYDRMLAYCLAMELAPEYERTVTPDVRSGATAAKRVLKRTNQQVPRMDMPYGIPGGWGGGGVYGGNAGANAIVSGDGDFIVFTP